MTAGADRVAASVARHASVEAWCERNFGTDELPAVKDPARRESCQYDLPRFLQTYLPYIFTRPFSPAGLRFLRDLQRLLLGGGLKAIAQPRGTGKTATISGSMIWAAVYGHRRYLVAIGATDAAAEHLIKDILSNLQGEMLLADFPEYAIPFMAIEGRPQRCGSQTYKGKVTGIGQKVDVLVLPSLLGEKGDGATIQAAGLTGAVRGMHQVNKAGVWVRPDFALLDDPQTRESAKSQTQTDDREQIILGDVMGLAGHDREISACMACTVIAKGDLADRFLDMEKRPEWKGQRERLVTKWGGTEKLWAEYDVIWRDEEAGRLPDGTCMKWWREHREAVEKGCRVLDPALFGSGEVSALQHARNLYLKHGKDAFDAEYQNDPPSLTPEAEYHLDRENVLEKLTHRARGAIPSDCPTVTAGVDVNRYAVAWLVVASNLAGDVNVIDYGWWTPPRRRQVWEDNENKEEQIAAALNAVVEGLLADRRYGDDLATIAIDAGYSATTVYDTAQALQLRHKHRRIVAARGLPGDRYVVPRNRRAVFALGVEADVRRQFPAGTVLYFNSHFWHLSTQKGWLLPMGAQGGTTVFGRTETQHAEFASQVTADELVKTDLGDGGRQVATFRVTRHNEQGDCLAMAAAAASLGMPAQRRKEERLARKKAEKTAGNGQGSDTFDDSEAEPDKKAPEKRVLSPSAKRANPRRRRSNWVTGGLF